MAINIYDKAMVVRKDGVKYHLVKWGCKNSFTCCGQYRIDNDLRKQYLTRTVRDSDWHVVAWGEGKMALTNWNAPTSSVYGRIMFGNKKNIALYLDKASVTEYEALDDEQKANVTSIINRTRPEYIIHLQNILGEQMRLDAVTYCTDTVIRLDDHKIEHDGESYWNLDNL